MRDDFPPIEPRLAGLEPLDDSARTALLEAIRDVDARFARAYELRIEGLAGRALAQAFGLASAGRPRGWAKAVQVFLGELAPGSFVKTDERVIRLGGLLLEAGTLQGDLHSRVWNLRDLAQDARDRAEYDNPAIRARETLRQRQLEEAEAEEEIEEEVEEDVQTSRTFQIYAWTYSGVPFQASEQLVKIGFAGTGPTSNAWRRMIDSTRTTGSPGVPTMLRVWEGEGTRDDARRAEAAVQGSAARRVVGGGDEWFYADLVELDRGAAEAGLDKAFGVNPS